MPELIAQAAAAGQRDATQVDLTQNLISYLRHTLLHLPSSHVLVLSHLGATLLEAGHMKN